MKLKSVLTAGALFCAMLWALRAEAQIVFFYKDLPAMAIGNENVEIQTSVDYAKETYYFTPVLNVRIKNNSTKVLYIDLGNTFFTANDEGRCYYIPSSQSTTEGQIRGVGVNVGGVNFGGGTTSSQTTTTFAQRIIAIPPMSATNLEPQRIITAPVPELAIYRTKNSMEPFCPYNSKKFPNRVPDGETRTYNPTDCGLQFAVMATCSFDESCSETFTVRRGHYIDRSACFKPWGIKIADTYRGKIDQDKLLAVFPDWYSWGDFFMISVDFYKEK